jgi:hypothetical protein
MAPCVRLHAAQRLAIRFSGGPRRTLLQEKSARLGVMVSRRRGAPKTAAGESILRDMQSVDIGHDAVLLMPEEPAIEALDSGSFTGRNFRTETGRAPRAGEICGSNPANGVPLDANEAQLTFHRQSRLGWAGHARGRGMAAGRHYNSQPGKWFRAKPRKILGFPTVRSAQAAGVRHRPCRRLCGLMVVRGETDPLRQKVGFPARQEAETKLFSRSRASCAGSRCARRTGPG